MYERESEAVHTPQPYYIGMAAVRLIFQPSDRLDEMLRYLYKPAIRNRLPISLRSQIVKVLHYRDGDVNGLNFVTMKWPGQGESDQEWLDNYQSQINTIQHVPLPLATSTPSIQYDTQGGLHLGLEVLPSLAIRRRLGYTLLQSSHDASEGSPRIITAAVSIPRSNLSDSADQREVFNTLSTALRSETVQEEGIVKPMTNSSRLYVSPNYISAREI